MDPKFAALLGMALTPRDVGSSEPHPCWQRWADATTTSAEIKARFAGELSDTSKTVLEKLHQMMSVALDRGDDQLFWEITTFYEQYISGCLSRIHPSWENPETATCGACNLMFLTSQTETHKIANQVDIVLCRRCKSQLSE